jgi:hypothetical protein
VLLSHSKHKMGGETSAQGLSHELWDKPNQEGGMTVKKTIIALVCGLAASLAFAQTSTTTTEETTSTRPTTTTESTTSTTYETGTVTTYEPGKTIVVRGEQGPVSFALGTAANIINAAGKVVTAPLRAGQRVRVYYTGPTEHRTVERVIVED